MTDLQSELIEVKPEFMGFHKGDYPGAFPPRVEERIRLLVGSPCLHLFSGSSKIGDERIDLAHKNATRNMDVYQFVLEDKRNWKWVVLDPVYHLDAKHIKNTLKGYARFESVSGIVLYQRMLEDFMKLHAENILWFDFTSPCPPEFYREKVWMYILGGYRHIRALTWLKRQGVRLDAIQELV